MSQSQPLNGVDATLWGITCYFNPIGFGTKLANYRRFRKHLAIPLVTVELAYDPGFDLKPDDAEILIQLRGKEILWQRERLLSIALDAVPSHCQKIAWLDCDIIFESDDWAERAEKLLDQCPLVQSFSEAYDLGLNADLSNPSPSDASEPTFSFAAKTRRRGNGVFDEMSSGPEQTKRFGTGLTWSFRRELFDQHGFYASGVLGGNDLAMACGACGRFDVVQRNWYMNEHQIAHYRNWAESFSRTVCGDICCLDERVFHLWHGCIVDRRYRYRHQGLAPFGFDPANDIALDESLCWCWNSDKKDLHDYVEHYFRGRREDG